jgi:hypothetical protein
MSIQANINQGLSLIGLLASQTPYAEERRVKKRVAAEAPAREAALEMKKKEAEIATAAATQKVEERLALEMGAKEEERQKKIGELTGIHEQHASFISDISRSKSGAIDRRKATSFEGHISAREAAIKSGEELRGYAPSAELEANIGKWRSEVEEIRGVQSEMKAEKKAKEREAKSERAAAKDRKRKEAEEMAKQAADAGMAETERLARSREITKMITEGVPLSRESQDYVNKRLGGNQ